MEVDDKDVSPHSDWPQVLEWAEKQSQENLKAKFQTAELITKEAQTTLTVILAAIGGSAAYAAKIFDPKTFAGPIEVSSALTCLYLIILAYLLVKNCMTLQEFPSLYQEPENILRHYEFPLTEIRHSELENLQMRINQATAINKNRAKSLNNVRVFTLISPFIFAITAFTWNFIVSEPPVLKQLQVPVPVPVPIPTPTTPTPAPSL